MKRLPTPGPRGHDAIILRDSGKNDASELGVHAADDEDDAAIDLHAHARMRVSRPAAVGIASAMLALAMAILALVLRS